MSASPTRRSVLTGAVVAVAGGVLGFVYGRRSDVAAGGPTAYGHGYGPTAHRSGGAALAAVTDIPEGGAKILSGAGVVLVRTGARVHALSATCTHQGCLVDRVSGGRLFCPCHGSVFDARTGAVVQGPATAPLPAVAVTVVEGKVYPA